MPKQTKGTKGQKAKQEATTNTPEQDMKAMLLAQAQEAKRYKEVCPQKAGGGRTPAENVLYPVPDGITPPYESTPDFELKGVTKDGIFGYLRTYSSGSKWMYKVPADGFKGESWKAAREHMVEMRKAVAEATK